jgi:glutathione S-transferase
VERADASGPRRGAGWLRRRQEGRAVASGPGPVPEAVVAELGKRLDDMVSFLRDRPFFFADQPSMADLAVYAGLHSIRLGGMTGGPELLDARPLLLAFMKRLEERTGGPLPESSIPPGARSAWLETE